MSDLPKLERSHEIYKGRIFTVRTDVLLDRGKERSLEIVAHPGSLAIVPITAQGVLLVRQYRHAAGRCLWEIPAGTAETDESYEDGARRELREETGCTAASWESLFTLYPTPGYCTEQVHVFAARELTPGAQALEEDEDIEVKEFTFRELSGMQASGDIADMKTIVALLWLAGA